MSRNVWLVLMLATGAVLVGGRAAAGQVAAAAEPGTPARAAEPDAAKPDAATPDASPDQTPSAAPDQAAAQKEAPLPTEGDGTLKSTPGSKALGMSILGNQEAPTALVIVPWKGSELGGAPGISLLLDDARQPVDKDVFMRALRYYDLRSEKKP